MLLSQQALNLLMQIRFPVLSLQASHLLQQVQLVCGITFTSNGLWGHNPARQGFAPLIPRLKGEMNMKKRIHEIKIRFSPDELATLNKQVEKAGISREQFCRNAIQGVAIRENPPADLHKLIWEIRRVGNNIDQILMIANTKGILNIPDLRKAIDDLREVEKLIVSQYT